MRTAVIVTTYNRPDALAAVLEGYLAQTGAAFELIVADDGSTAETGDVIKRYAARAPFPLRHVWQEDLGFRAAAVRNRALASTAAEYIIFTDGDCIPRRDFVARHCALAGPGFFLAGNRVLLSESFTRRTLAEHLPLHDWGMPQWFALRLAWQSFQFNDISQGTDATPLWIPQIGMALGSVIFAIAIADELVAVLRGEKLRHRAADSEPVRSE